MHAPSPTEPSDLSLPVPGRERWQPLRGGLINLFKYDDQEFRYEEGRLLLRGNNGAGKSRVLALQLPFLLDGEITSHRVEPDADPAKRMEWNLLMNQHENRLGYTWIEFGRIDGETGEARYLTLGCGLHARKGLGIQSRWYFITPARVGQDFRLLNDDRVPLTRERLEAELAARGSIYRGAREYRVAVDTQLFHLGPRYPALIELLLRLRQPQLSRKLDETMLSQALTEALPPVAALLIESIAQSFRSLEEERDQMEDFRRARADVANFLETYRHYARVITRRHAATVRETHSRYEQRQREIRRLEDDRESKTDEREETIARALTTRTQLAAREEEERTLRDSPEMKSAEDLRRASEHADAQEQQARRATEAESLIARERERAGEELREAETHAAECAQRHDHVRQQVEAMATEALLPGVIDALGTDEPPDRLLNQREEALRHLGELNRAIESAAKERERTCSERDRRKTEVDEASETAVTARAGVGTAGNEWIEALGAWERGLRELPWTADRDWREPLEAWMEDHEAEFPFEAELHGAYSGGCERIAREGEGWRSHRTETEKQRDSVNGELTGLREGRQPEPPVPLTRDPEVRASAAGAPLWKLCRFRDDCADAARAGFEAALEASGLLDAWVTPDGQLHDPLAHDLFLLPPAEALGQGLLTVLEAEENEAVGREVVESLLRRIGAAPGFSPGHGTWIAADGRWQNGALTGAWAKPAAVYLGHASREAARWRRIAELEAELARLIARLEEIDAALGALEDRRAQIESDRGKAPSQRPLLQAILRAEEAERALVAARERFREAEGLAGAAQRRWQEAVEARDRDAADLGLADWREPEALERMRELVRTLRLRLAEFWPERRALLTARGSLEKAANRLAAIVARWETAQETSSQARDQAAKARARYETLHATVGRSVEEVLARLRAVIGEIDALRQSGEQLRDEQDRLSGAIARLEAQAEAASSELERADSERREAMGQWHHLAVHRFLEETGEDLQPDDPGVSFSVSRAVDLARRAEVSLNGIDASDEAFTRSRNQLQTRLSELNDQLGMRGYDPQTEITDGGLHRVSCPFQGRSRTMTELERLLTEEVGSRERMLDAREREIIENHLIGEVATDLQRLIRAGEDWVRDVNEELAARPTSSGIKLRFAWTVDPEGPAGLDGARKHLLKASATWSPAEREGIASFLQDRIRAERAREEGASWPEQLTRALDYRRWHRFEIERFQDGQWRKLTRRTYGTGSGGEKAMTLTVPQFAAAAAHYRSASPLAPRIILLDEVFVGIDAQTREKLMGLLHSFDLDFVMTSEREWGCYSSVPALAIYQLASRPDVDAVHATRWVWNGRERFMTE